MVLYNYFLNSIDQSKINLSKEDIFSVLKEHFDLKIDMYEVEKYYKRLSTQDPKKMLDENLREIYKNHPDEKIKNAKNMFNDFINREKENIKNFKTKASIGTVDKLKIKNEKDSIITDEKIIKIKEMQSIMKRFEKISKKIQL